MSTPQRTEQRSRRSRVALAALAFLGIGAALTTAAWTDQVWFQAEAEAATFNLQGSTSPDDGWGEYATQGDALVIPLDASGFGDIVPHAGPLTTEVFVKNASSVPTTISVDTKTTGDLFAEGSTVHVTAEADTLTLEPGQYATIDLTLTAGEIPDAYQGATGSIVLEVSGATA